MRLQPFLITIAGGMALALASWVIVIFNIDPSGAGGLGIALFVAVGLLSVFGAFVLLGFGARQAALRRHAAVSKLHTSVRQAGFFTAMVGLWAILQSQRLVRWWNLVLMILLFVTLEFFFVSGRRHDDAQAYGDGE